MKSFGYAARMEVMVNAYKYLVGNSEARNSFGRLWPRWKDRWILIAFIWLRIATIGDC
jgi:hypothetical protein